MVGSMQQVMQRLHGGRHQVKTAEVDCVPLSGERTKQLSSPPKPERLFTDVGQLDAAMFKGNDRTPSASPQSSSAGEEFISGGIEGNKGKTGIKKKSSWSFHSSKAKKGTSQEWPAEFVCPISKALMADPVIVASGQTYERDCIEVWLEQGHRRCFQTGMVLVHLSVIPNVGLRNAILNWCNMHKLSKPQSPGMELAKQLVESNASRAFRSHELEAVRRSVFEERRSSTNHSEPGSDEIRSTVSGDVFPVGQTDASTSTQKISQEDDCSLWKSGVQNGEDGMSSRDSSLDFTGTSISSSELDSSTLTPSQEENSGPLWKGRGHCGEGSSRDSSMKLSRPSISLSDTNRSPTKGTSLLSSSCNDVHSRECPSHLRYVHSTSRETLLEDVQGLRIPLPLATIPSSYLSDEAVKQQAQVVVVDEVLQKLKHPHAMEQEEGACEIRRLTRESVDQRLVLCTPDLLAALIELLQSRYAGVQINAVAAIMNLSLEKENKVKIARAGAIPALIDVLKGRSDAAQEHAAGALFSLAVNDENKMAIGVLQAIPPLIHVLRAGPAGARRDAAMALYHLSFAHINRSKLIKAGAVPILLHLTQEESPDMVSRALLILSNLASVQEGRCVICELNGIIIFVSLLARSPLSEALGPEVGNKKTTESTGRDVDEWASVREHAAAALLQLSHHNMCFKSQALQAGALDSLASLAENGTRRGKEKAMTLLSILRDSRRQDNSLLTRVGGHSTPVLCTASGMHQTQKADSAQF